MRSTVIIPALNIAETIGPLLGRLFDVIEKNGLDADVLVVDGGSSDSTVQRVEERAGEKPVRVIRPDRGRGPSGDVLYAAGQTQSGIVVVMDGDLSHPPESLPALLCPVQDGSCDMVIGSRYVPGGKVPGWPWHRRLFSRAATILAWPLVSVRDPMAGFFAARRDLLLKFARDSDGYKIGLEMMAQSDDTLRVREVPITFTDRERGSSKLGWRIIKNYFKQIVRLAGGIDPKVSAARISSGALFSFLADIAVFHLFRSLGWGANTSQAAGFAVAALSVYLLIVRTLLRHTGDQGEEAGYFVTIRFVVISALALFLRWAVISNLLAWPQLPEVLTLAGGTAAAAAVYVIGIMFFLLPAVDQGKRTGIRWRVLALAAAGYSLALRILYAGIIDLIPEEAYYWNYGQHLDIGYLDHPPVVGWLNHISTGILGNHEMAVRLPAVLSWCLTVFFLYRLTKALFDKTAALIAVLMASVLPIYMGTGLFMMPDPPLYAAWIGALYFLSRALIDDRHRAWIGVGICLGLGMISKYTIVLLAPATLLFVLIHIRGKTRRTLLRPELYLGAVLSFFLFLPVIMWNARNGWASFTFQGTRRWSGISDFSLHILFVNILILITPLGAAAVFRVLVPVKGRLKSTLQDIDPEGVKLSFARVYAFVPLGIFVLHSFSGLSKFNWTGPVWLAVFPLLGGILSQLSRVEGDGNQTPDSLSLGSWSRNSAGCFLIFGGLLYYIATGMPGAAPIRGMTFPLAWHELARQIDSIPIREHVRGRPLVVGMEDYWIASEYSFYRSPERVKEPAGRHLVGRNSLMWSYWLDKRDAAGRDVILVALKPSHLEEGRLGRYFEKMGDTVELPLEKAGSRLAVVYYRWGFSYKPEP